MQNYSEKNCWVGAKSKESEIAFLVIDLELCVDFALTLQIFLEILLL